MLGLYLIICSQLIITVAGFILIWRALIPLIRRNELQWSAKASGTSEKAPSSRLRPIKHPPMEGALQHLSYRIRSGVVMSYYRSRKDPNSDPFEAYHYEEPSEDDGVFTADTYKMRDGLGERVVDGPLFRGAYEPAGIAMIISHEKRIAAAKSSNLVTPNTPPEEETPGAAQ